MRLSRGWLCAFFFVLTIQVGPATAAHVQPLGEQLSGGLVVEGAGLLLGDQTQAAEEARRANPEAVAARAASATAYEDLSTAGAQELAGESFPSLIAKPNGGVPRLPEGQRLTGFANSYAAQVDLGEGERGLVESSVPMAIGTSSGALKPIDLNLREQGGGFEGADPLVDARLPKQLGEGAELADIGISVTPVDARGAPLDGSAARLDGSTDFMANTLPDSDTVLKLSTYGFSIDTLLRSGKSPEQLSFRLDLPVGARLEAANDNSGAARVVKDGSTIAWMPAPTAIDAAGAPVPMSVHVSDDVVDLTVAHRQGSYLYPIAVDPEFNVTSEATKMEPRYWPFSHEGSFSAGNIWEEMWTTQGEGGAAGQWGAFNYATKGNSKIYEFSSTTVVEPTQGNGAEYWVTNGESYVAMLGLYGTKWEVENYTVIATPWTHMTEYPRKLHVCPWSNCTAASGAGGNVAQFVMRATSPSGGAQLRVQAATLAISQPKETHSTVSYNTSSPEIEYIAGGKTVKTTNLLHGTGNWIGPNSGALEFTSQDAGLGVSAAKVRVKKESTWYIAISRNYLTEGVACVGIQCSATEKEAVTYSALKSYLYNGYDPVRVEASDPMAGTWSSEYGEGETTLNVDNAAPSTITLSGVASKSGIYELDETVAHLKVDAKDGEGATPSSGVKSIAVAIDGKELGQPAGFCTPGPCTASGEWAINGGEVGAGLHALTIVATDNAGNVLTKEYSINIYAATAVGMGPGSLNPESGNFELDATDVNMSGGTSSLQVGRSFDSRNPKGGVEGPLGAQWQINLGSLASLEVLPDGSVMVNGPEGLAHFANKSGGGFEAPLGDANLTLESVTKSAKITAYLLKNPTKGTTTTFTLPSGAKIWMPTVSEGPIATSTTTDEYVTAEPEAGKKVVQPILEVAPHASATCAYKKLEKGCRALEFNYAASTTAGGEGESQWGDFKGDLTRVYFIAWDPIKKEMMTVTVAQYAYDSQGRLRAEWDPRISPALKTIYGYDSDGHVTSLTLPGRETWAFTYGSLAGDATSGRLLKSTQAPASAPLWAGIGVSNTEAPSISGTPIVGNRMTVSDGVWSGSPVVYGYQWQDCNLAGAECVSISGAMNPNYTPTSSDLGHRLVVKVTATNGGGSVASASAASSPVVVAEGPSSQAVDTGNSFNAVSCVPGTTDCVASDSKGSAYYATNVSTATVATWNAWSGPGTSPSEALSCPTTGLCLLADGSKTGGAGDLYYAQSLGGEWHTAKTGTYGSLAISCVSSSFCAAGDTAAWDRWSTNPTVSWGQAHQTPYVVGNYMNGISCVSSSFCVMVSNEEEVYVANTTAKIESSEWVKTAVTAWGSLRGVACVSTTSCVAVDNLGNAINLVIASSGAATATRNNVDGTNALTGITCTTSTTCVMVDNHGNIFISYNGGATWVKQYALGDNLTAVSCSSPSLCVAVDSVGTINAFDTAPISQAVDPGNSLNAISCVASTTDCIASDSKGNAFFTTNAVPGAAASWSAWGGPGSSPSEAVSCPTTSLCLLAAGEKGGYGGTLYYSTSLGGAWTQAYTPSNGVDAISCVSSSFCVTGQDGLGYFRYSTSPASTAWNLEQQSSAAMKSVSCISTSFCAMADGAGNVHVAVSTALVESSAWKETKVDGTTALNGIACTSTTACIAVDSAGNLLNLAIQSEGVATASVHKIDGSNSLTAVTCTTSSICVTVDNKGNVFASANNGATWSKQDQFGSGLTSVSCASSSLCLAADTSGDVVKLTGRTIYEGESRAPQPGLTVEYNVPVSGSGAPYAMSSSDVAKWAQTDTPSRATAVFPPDSPQGWPAAEYKRAGVFYMDSQARVTNVATPGGGVSTKEYNEYSDTVRTLSVANRAKSLEEGSKSAEVATLLDTQSVYAGAGSRLTETLGPQHSVKIAKGNEKTPTGSEAPVREHTKFYYNEGAPETGEAYNLVTKTTDGAETSAKEEFDVRTTTTSYSGQSNLGWKLRAATSTTTDPSGLKLTHTTVYNPTTGVTVETRGPASAGTGDPRDIQVVYYSAEANSSYPACGGHVEWSGLPCESLPGKQPGTSGLPELPVVTTAYDAWNQPEAVTEKFGTTSRTKKTTYDAAGRPLTSEVTSTNGVSLPAVTNSYNEKSGALAEEKETFEAKEKKIKRVYDRLGRMEEYVDADGGVTGYKYDVDGRPTEVNSLSSGGEGRGKQSYTYDPTSGILTKLVDSEAGTFTASYDAAGRMTSEIYPDKLTATYAHNAVGQTTGVEYTKTSYCASACPEKWFNDTVVPSIHGETLKQASTLSEEPNEVYDAAGRLVEVREVPAGHGCTTRIYTYDLESNRTSLTTRAPGAEGQCATEGGSVEGHSYDSANRLIDSGIAYETFGNVTKLPSADAGGSEVISSYYVDSQLAVQEQDGKATSYYMDPAGRVRETRAPGISVTHYAGPGSAVAWVSEPESKWTRDIPGIDGSLSAVRANTGAIALQLRDLQGNVVATAARSETETKLLSTYNSTEFGVPTTSAPPKYGWLGSTGVAIESTTGLVVQNGITYVPQTGRPLQTQGIAIPSPANAATPYVMELAPWVIEGTAGLAKQLTSAEEARRAAEEAQWAAEAAAWGGGGGGGGSGKAIGGGLEQVGGGDEASASAVPSCQYHWSLAEHNATLEMSGKFRCKHAVENMEIEMCIWRKYPGKPWSGALCTGKEGRGIVVKDKDFEEMILFDTCITGIVYTGQMWTHEWSGNHTGQFWSSGSIFSKNYPRLACEGPDPGEYQEIGEAFG
jgi:YD repeat-containing protein